MAKLVLDDIGSTLTNTAATTINNNNNKIEQALENTLSRDGSTPNNMQADLDMDSNDILNVDNIHANVIVLNGSTLVPGDVTEIPPGSIDTIALADGAVTTDKLANNSITGDKIADGAVGTADLANESITEAKIADLLANKLVYVAATRSEITSVLVDTTRYQVAYLNEGKRAGLFRWSSSNHATNVTNDPLQGVYIAPTADPTGASGAWVRETHKITPQSQRT